METGGPLMYPILACSLIGLSIFLERLWNLRHSFVVPKELIKKIRSLLTESKVGEAAVLLEHDGSIFSGILAPYLKELSNGNRPDISLIEDGAKRIFDKERWKIEFLGTLASISPLLGLLGTVFGMIEVFKKVTQMGVGDPSVLAEGIWEALLTTAFGLSVAIPLFLFYRLLQIRLRGVINTTEEELESIVYLIHNNNRK